MPIVTAHSLKFLIVDDEPFNLLALDGLLRLSNFEHIVEAYDGNHALKMMEENKYDIDVILTDYQMPGCNGVQLAEEVRHLQQQGIVKSSLQIILVSGDRFNQEFDTFDIAGVMRPLFDEKLMKPFSNADLKKVLTLVSLVSTK